MINDNWKSEEIVRHSLGDSLGFIPGGRVELHVVLVHVFIHFYNGCLIAASIAIVGGTKDSDYILVMSLSVAIIDQLMCSEYHLNVIVVIELFTDVLSESITCSSLADSPTYSFIGITPEEITHGTFMRDFLNSV